MARRRTRRHSSTWYAHTPLPPPHFRMLPAAVRPLNLATAVLSGYGGHFWVRRLLLGTAVISRYGRYFWLRQAFLATAVIYGYGGYSGHRVRETGASAVGEARQPAMASGRHVPPYRHPCNRFAATWK